MSSLALFVAMPASVTSFLLLSRFSGFKLAESCRLCEGPELVCAFWVFESR